MNTMLGLIHGVDYLLCTWLVGMFIFQSGITSAEGSAISSRFEHSRKLSLILTATIILVSFIWFTLVAVDMTESWNPSDLFAVATSTRFGHIGACKVGIILAIMILAFAKKLFRFWWIALVLPLCFSLSGHAGTEQAGIAINLIVNYLHLVAVSVWTGGLITLLFWLKARLRGEQNSLPANASILVVTRFSHFAMISTAIIGITGLVMALRFGLDPTTLLSTDYGKLVLAKTCLFTLALAAASVNQFVYMRRWKPVGEMQFTRSMCRGVQIELVIVYGIFILAGFLGRAFLPALQHQ